jgi:predicted MFS family arabinose efflux permease
MTAGYLRVLGGALLCYAALGAVLRVLPEHLAGDLGAGPVAVGLAVGAPALTGVLARPAGGRLADRFGAPRLLIVGALLMAVGVAPAVIATTTTQILSRLVVGAGEGMMMSAAVLWLLRLGGPRRRGRALGHIGLANYGGLTLGPLLADALAGGTHVGRVLASAAALPALGGLITAGVRWPSAPVGVSLTGTSLWRATLEPGVGLMLVNVGYVALLSFGAAAVAGHGAGGAALVVPAFAVTVIVVRTLGAGIPDRAGPKATLAVAAPAASAGLVIVSAGHATALVAGGVVVVAAGQALAVPSLGLLALERVPAVRHGAAAGVFFAFFDAGVGLGGPAAGLLARLAGPAGALAGAAVAVALAAGVAARGPRD